MAQASHWTSLLFSQALVWLPLIAGHQLHRRGMLPETLSPRLHKFNLFGVLPVVSLLAIWRLQGDVSDWYWSPLAMFILVTLSTTASWFLAQWLVSEPRRIGALAVMLPISNTGYTMAGFVTLLLVGEKAFAYNALIFIPYNIFLYLVWFPIGRSWSPERVQASGARGRMARGAWLRNMLTNAVPLLGLVVGGFLAWRQVPMPDTAKWLMRASTYVGTVLAMFAVGSRIRLRHCGSPIQPLLLWTYGMKFVAYPAIILLICLAAGLRGDLAAALVIASGTPVGVYAPGIAAIFNLDLDLANAGYVWSTLIYMALVLPLMVLVLRLPMFH